MSSSKSRKDDNKKNNINLLRAIFLVISIAFIIISIKFYKSILNMNMLPAKYTIIFTIIIGIITIMLFIGLAKKHKTLKLNIFCLILTIIISISYIFANNYVDKTMDFLDKILTEIQEVEEYYVIVRENSSYNSLEDVNNKEICAFQIENDVRETIESKVNITLKFEESLSKLGNDLINEKIDVIIVSASQYNILSEEIGQFKEQTKIINTETHKIENKDSIEDVNSKYTITDKVFNVYISGMDTFGNINQVSRSDANILATVNLDTHEILLTSIPRDYYVTLHSKRAKDKLTHSGIYGITETVTTVEDLFNIDINYYLRVNFTTVVSLVDTLGGIDVYSDDAFKRAGNTFVKGYNHLNGQQALMFSRERYLIEDGDNKRIQNQQKVIEAIMNKVLNSKTILSKYTDILDVLSGSFNTNVNLNDVGNIVKIQLDTMPVWKIKHIYLTGSDANKPTYSMGTQELAVVIPNQSSIKEAKDEIQRVMETR